VRAEAIRLIAQARPDDAGASAKAGAAAARYGAEEEAIPLLTAATGRHPGDPLLWQLLGLAYRGIEDSERAIAALSKAARLAPDNPLIAHALARAQLEAGLPALELFDKAHHLAPLDAQIMLGRAAAQVAEGARIGEAIDALDRQLHLHPGWLQGHRTACRLRWMGGEQDGFTASFERALAADPRQGILWREMVLALLQAEQYDPALAAIARARDAVGSSATLDGLEAAALSEKGETAAAGSLFARLQPVGPGPLLVRYLRHLLRAGQPEEAARLAGANLAGEAEYDLWPYLALGWRLTGDPRWQWLEGDPRFIGVYDLGDQIGSLPALADRLRALHVAQRHPLEQSPRGGTQTDGPLLARIEPEIRALRHTLLEAVRHHVAQLPPEDPRHPLLRHVRAPLRFSGSWSVRLLGGGRHVDHVHPAGWISSALYVSLPDTGMGGPDRAGWLTLGAASELGLDLPALRTVEPKPGRLVLFPSTMWHGTRQFTAGERLTVAFDMGRPQA